MTETQPQIAPASILIVDDDPIAIRVLGNMLAGCGRTLCATSGESALRLMRASPPDLVLLDADMPGISGTSLCRMIKQEPSLADIPVIFVTNQSDPDFEAWCFDLGAVDYVQKPVRAPVLLARAQTHIRLKRLNDELRHNATIDALTEVANRRVFEDTLHQEWSRALRSGEPLSLMLVDVDHFKSFNDNYGHQAGDECLRAFAEALRKGAGRTSDLVARYGGEEFAILLPGTDAAGAQAVAAKLLEQLRSANIPHAHSPVAGHVTASIGVSSLPPRLSASVQDSQPPAATARDPHGLVSIADQALYAAKSNGRDRAHYLPFPDLQDMAHAQHAAAGEA